MAALAASGVGEWEIEVPISALEHYAYCPRQCALIHIEGIFDDNQYTVRGSLVHERVHQGEEATERGVPVQRGMRLYSAQYGLVGKADLVELRPEGPYPVEYKSGRRHGAYADLQLCAQALCLEEAYGCPVPLGAIFYFRTRTRHEVAIDQALRERTLSHLKGLRAMLTAQIVPLPAADKRCRNCSLQEACLPELTADTVRQRGLQMALFCPMETVTGD